MRAEARRLRLKQEQEEEAKKKQMEWVKFCYRKACQIQADRVGESVSDQFKKDFRVLIERKTKKLLTLKSMREEFDRLHKHTLGRVQDEGVEGWSAEKNGTKEIRHSVTRTIRAGAPTDWSRDVPLSHRLIDHGPPRSTTYYE